MALYYNFAFAAKEEQPIWMVKLLVEGMKHPDTDRGRGPRGRSPGEAARPRGGIGLPGPGAVG